MSADEIRATCPACDARVAITTWDPQEVGPVYCIEHQESVEMDVELLK